VLDGKRSRSHSPIPAPANEFNPSPKKPRLPTLHTVKRKTALETFLAKKGEPSVTPALPIPIQIDEDEVQKEPSVIIGVNAGGQRWICPTCSTVFIPLENGDGIPRPNSLTEQRQEHEDYHFAMDLQDGDKGGGRGGSEGDGAQPKVNAKVKKKPLKKPEGIKAFFASKPLAKKEAI